MRFGGIVTNKKREKACTRLVVCSVDRYVVVSSSISVVDVGISFFRAW